MRGVRVLVMVSAFCFIFGEKHSRGSWTNTVHVEKMLNLRVAYLGRITHEKPTAEIGSRDLGEKKENELPSLQCDDALGSYRH